jgi:hypothetical protein
MSSHAKKYILLLVFLFFSLSCRAITGDKPGLPSQQPQVVLERLSVAFLGLDGHKVIGSGCPGTYDKSVIEDYHLIVGNVDAEKKVQRILVAGDNSTLTWELPCSNDWALSAENLGNGNWEIFIAPSLPSKVYTVIFFYTDNTFALGMAVVP